jgi:hypothetical protein
VRNAPTRDTEAVTQTSKLLANGVARLVTGLLAVALFGLTFLPPVDEGQTAQLGSMWSAVPGRSSSGWNLVGLLVVLNLLVSLVTLLRSSVGQRKVRMVGVAASSGLLLATLGAVFIFFATKPVVIGGPAPGVVAQKTQFASGATAALWIAMLSFTYAIASSIYDKTKGRRGEHSPTLQTTQGSGAALP